MELREQGKEIIRTPGSLAFGEVSDHNGVTVANFTTRTQTLDHHHHHHLQQQQAHLNPRGPPDPDRVSSFPGGSNQKPPSKAAVRYRECLRNHAASIGGTVVDGCGEFMPSGEDGTIEALKCAACQCHRNFHRKEVDGETQFSASSRRSTVMVNPLQFPQPPPLPSPHHHHHHQKFSMAANPSSAFVQPMNIAFGGGGGTESSSEDLNVYQSNAEAALGAPPPFGLSKKRFRTKFTQEQKEKMMGFAEKVGWRILKQDEEEIERFCAEIGVKRQVLKVWMHNNKAKVT